MPVPPSLARLSPRRAILCSFESAYAVAVQTRRASGVEQFVVATGDPIQPYRVTRVCPPCADAIMAMVA